MKLSKSIILTLICILSINSGCVLIKLAKQEQLKTQGEQKDNDFFVLNKSIKTNIETEYSLILVQKIAEPYLLQKDWLQSIEIFENYRPFFKKHDRYIRDILSSLKALRSNIDVIYLDSKINLTGNENMPVLSPDHRLLYHTKLNKIESNFIEETYVTDIESGNRSEVKKIDFGFENNLNGSCLSITSDGNLMLIFGNYIDSYGAGDIYFLKKNNTKFNDLSHFPNPINSEFFESDGLLVKDSVLFFVSDRPGGVGNYYEKGKPYHGSFLGNTDIYISIKRDDVWSEPINLGSTINTPFSERTPYFSSDGKTLYFSSDGHFGFGRLDIFKSTRLNENSWTEWSRPENLGKEINTPYNDYGFKLDEHSNTAYFSINHFKPEDKVTGIYKVKFKK